MLDSTEVSVPCPVCRESIKRDARKCVHCNSMLDDLELAVWNQGNKNAQVLSAKISVKTNDGKQPDPIELEVDSPPTVFTGHQTVLDFIIPQPLIPICLTWPHKDIQIGGQVVDELMESRPIQGG